jgi:hypothetical protein
LCVVVVVALICTLACMLIRCLCLVLFGDSILTSASRHFELAQQDHPDLSFSALDVGHFTGHSSLDS